MRQKIETKALLLKIYFKIKSGKTDVVFEITSQTDLHVGVVGGQRSFNIVSGPL